MSEADRLAAALKQEQWAHTDTAKRGTSSMVAAFDAERARRIRAEERVEHLEQKIEWVINDALYTAPEDHHRQRRQLVVLRDALKQSEHRCIGIDCGHAGPHTHPKKGKGNADGTV